jgi:hypothetical protein
MIAFGNRVVLLPGGKTPAWRAIFLETDFWEIGENAVTARPPSPGGKSSTPAGAREGEH